MYLPLKEKGYLLILAGIGNASIIILLLVIQNSTEICLSLFLLLLCTHNTHREKERGVRLNSNYSRKNDSSLKLFVNIRACRLVS